MTTENSKTFCVTCGKERATSKCTGCLQDFCYTHFKDHHQELNKQLDQIEVHGDLFKQKLNVQINRINHGLIIEQIDRWEEDSIRIIQRTANECREILFQYRNTDIQQIEVNLMKLTEQLGEMRQENDFNETDIQQIEEKFNQLKEQFNQIIEEIQPSNTISIQSTSTPLVHKISVLVSSQQSLCPMNIKTMTKWKPYGVTIAGGDGKGTRLNQFSSPRGIYIDGHDRTVYVADYENHRILKWKQHATNGQIVAGGNGQGSLIDQLNRPTDVIIDRRNNALIICDRGNSRVIRKYLRNDDSEEVIISDVYCSRLAMDSNGNLYVSDCEKNEVRRWRPGDTNGVVVAGGNGRGDHLCQFDSPTHLFVDADHSVYISDHHNHRVMKWIEGARKGIVVAGGQGPGDNRTQLDHPQGLIVDHLGNIYVADSWNHRVMRWSPGAGKGSIIVGGNGRGEGQDQFQYPVGLAFDRKGNLYVVDQSNNRVQKFHLDVD